MSSGKGPSGTDKNREAIRAKDAARSDYLKNKDLTTNLNDK